MYITSPRAFADSSAVEALARVRLVWIIDRQQRSAIAWRSRTDFDHVTEEGVLHGGDVVPGFSVRLGGLFD